MRGLLLLVAFVLLAGCSAWADEADICHSAAPLISPETLRATMEAQHRYRTIVEAGGWSPIEAYPVLRRGSQHEHVVKLRQRLMTEGDLAADKPLSDRFDGEVRDAVKHFQTRYGLEVSGVADQKTFEVMNIPAALRLHEIEDVTAQLRDLTQKPYGRLVTVNIPAAEAEAIENGMVVDRYRVIVGMPEHPSPVLSARILAVNFHPAWVVPLPIVREEIIRRVQEEPDYLEANNFHLYRQDGYEVDPATLDWNSSEPARYTFRQDPGPANPMGNIRLNMPNKFMVYMHDTPLKKLFQRSCRVSSAGCVRVEHIERLATWLLKDNPGWTNDSVEQAVGDPMPQDVTLAQPVPVEWVYLPAWTTPEGMTCFRPDVYGRVK